MPGNEKKLQFFNECFIWELLMWTFVIVFLWLVFVVCAVLLCKMGSEADRALEDAIEKYKESKGCPFSE